MYETRRTSRTMRYFFNVRCMDELILDEEAIVYLTTHWEKVIDTMDRPSHTHDPRVKVAKGKIINEDGKPILPSVPWPPLSVRRAIAVLREFYPLAHPEVLSSVGRVVAASADDQFGNGSPGLRRAERIAVVAFEATLSAIYPKEPVVRIRRSNKADSSRRVAHDGTV